MPISRPAAAHRGASSRAASVMAGVPVEQFPIRTVSSLTGVNPITLRAWERRYGLIQPTRTDSGHRVYSRADVDTIHRIVALMQKGVAIGQMGSALGEAQVPGRERVARGPWPAWLEGMIAAVAQFDEVRLERSEEHTSELQSRRD